MSCRTLRARSVDAAFLQILSQGSFRGRVHSVFRRVINIECATGELFTLAASQLDSAPNTALVDVASFKTLGILENDPVTTVDGKLRVGDGVVMQWATALPWQAKLPRFAGANGCLPSQLQRARSYLDRRGLVPANGAATSFAKEIAKALMQRSALLAEALAQDDHASARRHAESLVGLGPGLTPSGDDFLVGMFAVLNLAGSPCYGHLCGGRAVLAYAKRSTNAISLAAMTAAADGRVRGSLSQLIEALLSGTPASLTESLDRVMAIGRTSGSDMIAGILAGLELNLNVEGKRATASDFQQPVAGRKAHSAHHTVLNSTGA